MFKKKQHWLKPVWEVARLREVIKVRHWTGFWTSQLQMCVGCRLITVEFAKDIARSCCSSQSKVLYLFYHLLTLPQPCPEVINDQSSSLFLQEHSNMLFPVTQFRKLTAFAGNWREGHWRTSGQQLFPLPREGIRSWAEWVWDESTRSQTPLQLSERLPVWVIMS